MHSCIHAFLHFYVLRLHSPPSLFAGHVAQPAAESFRAASRRCARPDVLLRSAVFIVCGVDSVAGHRRRHSAVCLSPRRCSAAKDRRPRRFSREDEAETEKSKQEARRTAEAVYENNARLLEEVRQELTNKVGQPRSGRIVRRGQAKPELKNIWHELSPPLMSRGRATNASDSSRCERYFTAGMDSNRFDEAIKRALSPLEKNGLLKELKHKPRRGQPGLDSGLSGRQQAA